MKLIHFCSLLTLFAVASGTEMKEEKKTEQRDTGDSESVDYNTLSKIPVFVIPNTPPGSEGKVPIALITNAYPSQEYATASAKKPYKYGFYAPYKTSKVTPIHEPQTDHGYRGNTPESPAAAASQTSTSGFQPSPEIYQHVQFDPSSAYKIAAAAAASVAGIPSPNAGYIKYEQSHTNTAAKSAGLVGKQGHNYAPVYATYPPLALPIGENGVPIPQIKKFTTYDAINNLQIQYVIKYIPVPYSVPAGSPGLEYTHPSAPEAAYITPKPIFQYKEVVAGKKPLVSSVQTVPAHHSNAAGSYASSTENYVEYAKYAESYTRSPDQDDPNPHYSQLIKSPSQGYIHSPHHSQFQPSPAYSKYYEKNSYSKKYGLATSPTSYVLSSLGGKSAATQYSTSIHHDTPHHQHDNNPVYATKLAPVPLTVDKYTSQDTPEEAKGFSEQDYPSPQPSTHLYSVGVGDLKYKSALEPVSHQLPYDQIFNFEYNIPYHYQKKDVSVSLSSADTSSPSSLSGRKMMEASTRKA